MKCGCKSNDHNNISIIATVKVSETSVLMAAKQYFVSPKVPSVDGKSNNGLFINTLTCISNSQIIWTHLCYHLWKMVIQLEENTQFKGALKESE